MSLEQEPSLTIDFKSYLKVDAPTITLPNNLSPPLYNKMTARKSERPQFVTIKQPIVWWELV